MSASRILPRLVIILGFAFFGATIGVSVQALRITGRPQEFRSLGKLAAAPAQGIDPTATWYEQQEDILKTITETIKSAEMKRRANERVKALNPELKDSDVDISIAHVKSSSILNLLATSTEPKYTRIFLDALLDEFMIFRMKTLEEAKGETAHPEIAITVQERATPAFESVADWRMPIAQGAGAGGILASLVGFALSLLILRSPKPLQTPTAV